MATRTTTGMQTRGSKRKDAAHEHDLRETAPPERSEVVYVDLEALSHTVNVEKGPVAGSRAPIPTVEAMHAGANVYAPSTTMQKLSNPVHVLVNMGISLTYLSKIEIDFRAMQYQQNCEKAQHHFAAALLHFDVHRQFFTSTFGSDRPDKVKDIIATLREVKRAANEMFAPLQEYAFHVSKFRVFLAHVLDRLPYDNVVRVNITISFNKLSLEYEQKENGVREEIGNLFVDVHGEVGEKLDQYVKAFKERGEMLKAHQGILEKWVKEAVAELPAGEPDF